MTLPKCPHCGSEFTYELFDTTFGCSDGDDVIIVQDLPVKGMPKPIKKGTKAKNIRINENGKNGHFIDAKIEGFGAIGLKGSVVKKG